MIEEQELHILFVDDDIRIRNLVMESVAALVQAGYKVWEAESRGETKKALDLIKVEKAPLLLLIVDGFGGRGDEIIDLVHQSIPGLPSLLFSSANYGFGDSFLMKQAVESGGTQVLVEKVHQIIKR